jgi:hypothetical protein
MASRIAWPCSAADDDGRQRGERGHPLHTHPPNLDGRTTRKQPVFPGPGGSRTPAHLTAAATVIVPGMATRTESDWIAILRALDEPGELGKAAGLEFPRDFDLAATQLRFDRLAARLGDVFGCPLRAGPGPCQDASLFGRIRIPPEFTATRAEPGGMRFPVNVAVSNFGSLATCLPERHSTSPGTLPPPAPPVAADDHDRIERVLNELGYLFVPADVHDVTYEGPNQWVFGDWKESWYVRYFDYL